MAGSRALFEDMQKEKVSSFEQSKRDVADNVAKAKAQASVTSKDGQKQVSRSIYEILRDRDSDIKKKIKEAE